MAAHDGLDGLACLVGIVKRNGADKVMKDVGFNDAVEKMAPYEPEFAINGGSSPTSKVPGFRSVVRKGWISVLKEGDCN